MTFVPAPTKNINPSITNKVAAYILFEVNVEINVAVFATTIITENKDPKNQFLKKLRYFDTPKTNGHWFYLLQHELFCNK